MITRIDEYGCLVGDTKKIVRMQLSSNKPQQAASVVTLFHSQNFLRRYIFIPDLGLPIMEEGRLFLKCEIQKFAWSLRQFKGP
jgi:hypothetical protein